MGGRGAFVWGAYGTVGLAIVVEVLTIRARLARARRAAVAENRGRVAAPGPQ